MTGTAPSRVLLRRTATVVSEVFAPGVLVAVVLPVVGWGSTHSPAGVVWGLFAALFCAVVPYTVVLAGVRRGYWSNHHIPERGKRTVPFLIAIGSVAAGTAALAALGAPRAVFALVAAMLAGLVSTTVVTRWWKISVHTAVAAGVVCVLALVHGPALVALLPLAGAVGWSRVALNHHTTAQAVAGAVLGAAVCASFFTLLR